jgi:hypothetical protein
MKKYCSVPCLPKKWECTHASAATVVISHVSLITKNVWKKLHSVLYCPLLKHQYRAHRWVILERNQQNREMHTCIEVRPKSVPQSQLCRFKTITCKLFSCVKNDYFWKWSNCNMKGRWTKFLSISEEPYLI